MRNSRRKKRAQEGRKSGEGGVVLEEEDVVVSRLVEAFASLASAEEAKAAYKEANGDADKAAEILTGLLLCDDGNDGDGDDNVVETETETETVSGMSCSSSCGGSGSGSSSSEGLGDVNGAVLCDGNGRSCFKGSKGKKAAAATGMVSNMMGRGYLGNTWRTRKVREWSDGRRIGKEESEQFLFSLLGDGDGCDASMAVVKDVLGFCDYDIEKAMDILLDLYPSTSGPGANERDFNSISSSREDSENSDNLTDWTFDSTSLSSDKDVEDNSQALDYSYRNYLDALLGSSCSGERHSSERHLITQTNDDLELPEKVLRSLFNIPERSQRDPGSMNWKNVVKQVESFAQMRVELYPPGTAGAQQVNHAKGAEYQAFREPANRHWDSVKSQYQKAAMSHSNGAREYASYLSDQAKLQTQLARKEDEKASMEIFNARNRALENVLTIDLHGQHVKQAIRLVKLHLLFATYISSVQYLRVITGCGDGGVGKSHLKESVIGLLEREKIQWKEENRGAVVIRLNGPREFSFLESGSDSD